MTAELYRACQTAVHVITPNQQIFQGGQAVVFVLDRLGYPVWLIQLLRKPPFNWLVEAGYNIVARYRAVLARFVSKKS